MRRREKGGLTKLELQIREYLLDGEFVTIAGLANDLGVSLHAINPSLQRLWHRGLIAQLSECPEPKPERQQIRWAKR